MARSRTDVRPRPGAPPRRGVRAALLAVAAALLLPACGAAGAQPDPAPTPSSASSPSSSPGAASAAPIPSDGVAPGSGTLTPAGHRETDTDLDTWVAPDRTAGTWYAFPVPSGYAAEAPPAGAELLLRSAGQARTAVTVTRIPQEDPLDRDLLLEAAAAAGRLPQGEPVARTLAGVPALALDALEAAGSAREDPALVRQIVLDVGGDRLVISIATDAEHAEAELGLVESVALDNMRLEVLD